MDEPTATDLHPGNQTFATQARYAGVDPSDETAKPGAPPNDPAPSRRPSASRDHRGSDTHDPSVAAGNPSASRGHLRGATNLTPVAAGNLSTDLQAVHGSLSSREAPGSVDTSSGGDGQAACGTQSGCAVPPDLSGWLELRTAVEVLEASMEYRKAFDNRVRAGNAGTVVEAMRAALHVHETKAELHAKHVYRAVVPEPIRAWQDSTRGMGEKGVARLLGHIGDPSWKWVHAWQGEGKCKNAGKPEAVGCTCSGRHLVLVDSSPRTFGQLIAYAGLVPGRERSKGMSAEEVARCGAPSVGPILHSLAEACMKSGGPFRDIYDAAKERYTEDRPEWGPRPGHWHNAALRIVKREILRGLWTAAQR